MAPSPTAPRSSSPIGQVSQPSNLTLVLEIDQRVLLAGIGDRPELSDSTIDSRHRRVQV